MCVCMYVNVLGGQKRVLESLGLELQGVGLLGTKLGCAGRAANTFDQQPLSQRVCSLFLSQTCPPAAGDSS